MNLTELKNTPVSELITLGENMGLENLARMRKQDIIFSILKQHAKSGEDIFGDGVLEDKDGFGFLRSGDSSYLAGPDDIYVSPGKSAASTSAQVTPFPVRFVRQRRRALFCPVESQRSQLRQAGKRPQQDPVRELDAAAPIPSADGARQRFDRT